MKSEPKQPNAIEKALTILNLFTPNNQEMGTMEISQKLGFHKATTSRTLLLLTQYGFLEQNESTKKFKLGPAALFLSLSFNRSLKNELVQLAKPQLEKLAAEVQETVVMEVLSGRVTVMGCIAEGPTVLKLAGDIGDVLPVNAAAGAKAVVAFANPETWDIFLDQNLPKLTPKTMIDPEQLKQQYRQIREEGISYDFGEHDTEINAIGAPIFNKDGAPVAAVVVVGLTNRVGVKQQHKQVPKLKATARKITEMLVKLQNSQTD